MLICSLGHGEFVHKVGTSKSTGKPYDFWSCPGKLANGDYCQDKGIEKENYDSAQAFDNSVSDNRSYRIERQHQTQMAIESLELLFKIDEDKLRGMVADKGIIKVIKETTDVFMKDLDKE